MNLSELQVRRQATILTPDKSRVLLRPFLPTPPSSPGHEARVKGIIRRVIDFPEEASEHVLDGVLGEFRDRHRDVEGFFDERFNHLTSYMPRGYKPSRTKRLLIGSYFAHEYSLEAAALFNPSIVLHPDQSGLASGSIRIILSLRATGEGHISSIEFRTGMIDSSGELSVDAPERHVESPEISADVVYKKAEFKTKLRDQASLTSAASEILRPLPAKFKRAQLMVGVARYRHTHPRLSPLQSNCIRSVEALADLNYEISFPETSELSERVIFPVSLYERNGIEDARFVRFVDEYGIVTYYATYTAYNGTEIRPQLLQTTDFTHFQIRSLSGNAATNKGMALFPRKIGGEFIMVTRHDAENLYIARSDDVTRWTKPVKLRQPRLAWEFTQIGNCGTPLETERGWLLLTHGVGPVRKYCIGAVLLDRDNPAKQIGELPEPLLAPDESEREGYVPNVVYTCGAILHNGKLIIPYAMSDTATRIASVHIDELLTRMR